MPKNNWRLTDAFDRQSKGEGWALFDNGETIDICKIDDVEEVSADIGATVPELPSDTEAVSLVISKALGGSKLHAFALYLDGRQTGDETNIPKESHEFCDGITEQTSIL